MKRGLIVVGLGLAVIVGTAWDALAQGPGGRSGADAPCTTPHQMKVVDIEMRPDPVTEGQSVQGFSVKLQSDRDGDCRSSIEVRDQKRTLAKGVRGTIKRGTHTYTVPAQQGQKFEGIEYCFKVFADIAATPTASPAPAAVPAPGKTFCAKRPAGAPPAGSAAPGAKSGWDLKSNKKI